ncbi:MAG TPA: hypothetical protein VMU41_02925 [Candidatus Binataceae bacterium]|nr:hypothetical protein [Candidatus Binataceae bacterium]
MTGPAAEASWFSRRRSSAALLGSLLLLNACSVQEPVQHTYYRTAQTEVTLDSLPSGNVSIGNRFVGSTPLKFPLDYEQEVEEQTTKVTLWQTQPGLALFITVISLGLYLPFSAIPVATQSTETPLDRYQNNQFLIAVDAPGYERWTHQILANGEPGLELHAQLTKKGSQ